jgi:hypothetical protein
MKNNNLTDKKINKRTNKKINKIRINKKASSEMWWIIVVALIALIVVILILVWFRGTGEKAYGVVGTQIGGLGDCDKDNVADMFDKCPCEAGSSNAELDGCPSGITKEQLEEHLKTQKKLGEEGCCKK